MNRKLFLLLLAFALVASSADAKTITADRISIQAAGIAQIESKIEPFNPPIPPVATVVTSTKSAGHSSSLSSNELARLLYCSRTFDFKTRKWKVCEVTPAMSENIISSWVKNRNKVHGNIPTWIN